MAPVTLVEEPVIELEVKRAPLRLVTDNEKVDPECGLNDYTDGRWHREAWRGYEAYQLAVECGMVPDAGNWFTLTTEQTRPFMLAGEVMLQRERLAFQRGERSEGLDDMRQDLETWKREVEIYQEERNEAQAERDTALARLAAIELATGLKTGITSLDELERTCKEG